MQWLAEHRDTLWTNGRESWLTLSLAPLGSGGLSVKPWSVSLMHCTLECPTLFRLGCFRPRLVSLFWSTLAPKRFSMRSSQGYKISDTILATFVTFWRRISTSITLEQPGVGRKKLEQRSMCIRKARPT